MNAVPFRQKKSAAGLVAAMRSDDHAPFSAMIEIADRCNETCVHCYQVQGQKGELETDDWRRILDELAQLGVVFLTISGGEATLRKDFLELVAHARRLRFAVKIFTNGLTMTRELAASLGALAVQEVQISLYSHRAEVHDAVTCVPGSWTKTVQGAGFLVESGVKVVLKSPLMKVNQDEIAEYAAFVTGMGCDFSVDPNIDPREDGDRAPEALRMGDDAWVRTLRDPLLRPGPPAERGQKSLDGSLCGACSGNVHIEANGEIRPCTLLTVPVGHAITDGVAKAWHGDETGRAIRAVTWRDLPACRQCDLRPYCGRCFANARVEAGDALAPYASACRTARLEHEVTHGRAPEIVAGPERADVELGPYRLEGEHYVTFVAELTDDDRARAAKNDWARSTTEPLIQLGIKKKRSRRSALDGSAGRG